ncbi:MAG TPA: hypothetical protein VF148_17095 [Acidimicrobiia bacterium]
MTIRVRGQELITASASPGGIGLNHDQRPVRAKRGALSMIVPDVSGRKKLVFDSMVGLPIR